MEKGARALDTLLLMAGSGGFANTTISEGKCKDASILAFKFTLSEYLFLHNSVSDVKEQSRSGMECMYIRGKQCLYIGARDVHVL